MNDNEHELTPHWARQFCGHTEESLIGALGVLAGLIEKPHPFENCAATIRRTNALVCIRNGTRRPPMEWKMEILNEVASKHAVTISEMTGPTKTQHIADARHEACYRLREEMGLKFPRIGVIMGNRDSSTALNSWRRHRGVLEGVPYMKTRYPNVAT